MHILKISWISFIVFFFCFATLSERASGRRYEDCWNGVNSFLYSGTEQETLNKHPCQRWDSDQLSHGYQDSDFIDGSVEAAGRYCRNPSNDDSYPWCYTTVPGTLEWEICNVKICENLKCVAGDLTGATDNAILESLSYDFDTGAGVVVLLTDFAFGMHCCATVKQWKFWVTNAGKIRLQAWRYNSASGTYRLLGENIFIYTEAQTGDYTFVPQTEDIVPSQRISVEYGDYIGWYVETAHTIPFAAIVDPPAGHVPVETLILSTSAPPVGAEVDFGAANVVVDREYAIGALFAINLSPTFDQTVTEIEISETTPISTEVFLLAVTDGDPYDVADLQVRMATPSDYFGLDTLSVVTTSDAPLPDGVYILEFVVIDHCKDSGRFTLTITVTKRPVSINNLPGSGNFSESAVDETFVKTLTFDSTGPHTCEIVTYDPERDEGSPFIVKSDVDVYTKSNANVRYNDVTRYTVNVSCTDGSSSDSGILTIDVDPNTKAEFVNWEATKTISASDTNSDTVVYTATVVDPEDTVDITMASCEPPSCPFTVISKGDNKADISATENLLLHQVSPYTIRLAAYDNFNIVTSPPLTIILDGKNVKPIFTNIPTSKGIVEGTASGVSVFHVSYIDDNEDPVTLATVYDPPACESLFYLDPGSGEIRTLADLDYETVVEKECSLTVIANDGKVNSEAAMINLTVTNFDEPPVLTKPVYTIATPEVTSGTELPDPNISVTDPEETAVSVGPLDCGSDTGNFDLDSTTRRVTMVTAYDLDDPPVATKTITCTFICTDETSQTVEGTIKIEITNSNDEKPTFPFAAYSKTIENTQSPGVIISVAATDNDGFSPDNQIIYTLSGSTKFIIDETNGDISLNGDITSDVSITQYVLTVTATDQGSPSFSDSVQVTISVTGTTTSSTTPSTTSTTTTSTTLTSTTTGTVVIGGGLNWLDNPISQMWLAILILLLLALLAVTGFLIYLCYKRKSSSGANLTDIKVNNNNNDEFAKRDANKNESNTGNKAKPLKRTSHGKASFNKSNGGVSILSLEEPRPGSGDSGINVSPTSVNSGVSLSPTSPTSPTSNASGMSLPLTSRSSDASLTGISIHPSEENLSGNKMADVETRRHRLQRILSQRFQKPWRPY